MCSWYRPEANGLTLYLRVTPRAGVDRIEGVEQRDDGSFVLRLRVRAVPDRGRANDAVIALLSGVFGVAKSHISITTGEAARLKTVVIKGDAAALGTRAAQLAAGADRDG